MPRTKNGWLKADALRTAYIKEQYSVMVGQNRSTVELFWRDDQYVVSLRNTEPSGKTAVIDTGYAEDALDAARIQFTKYSDSLRAKSNQGLTQSKS